MNSDDSVGLSVSPIFLSTRDRSKQILGHLRLLTLEQDSHFDSNAITTGPALSRCNRCSWPASSVELALQLKGQKFNAELRAFQNVDCSRKSHTFNEALQICEGQRANADQAKCNVDIQMTCFSYNLNNFYADMSSIIGWLKSCLTSIECWLPAKNVTIKFIAVK